MDTMDTIANKPIPDMFEELKLLSNFSLILEAIKIKEREIKYEIEKENEIKKRYDIYVANHYGDPLPIDLKNIEKTNMLKTKSKSRISVKPIEPYRKIRKQSKLVSKAREHIPVSVPDINNVLHMFNIDSDYLADFCQQEQLEENNIHKLKHINLKEAYEILHIIDCM